MFFTFVPFYPSLSRFIPYLSHRFCIIYLIPHQYPGLMRQLVWLTPFPSMLAVLGAWIVSNDAATHTTGFFHQLFWVIVCVALAAATNRAMLRRIQAGE